MFILTHNHTIERTAREESGRIGDMRQALSDSSAGLTFEPEGHRYFLGGRELLSVSAVVSHFAPVDTATLAAKASRNPRHPLFGMSAGEIAAVWAIKRDAAAAAGTRIHSFAEACCHYLHGREDLIGQEWAGRVTPGGFLAEEPKEEAVARWWAGTDWSRYAVVGTETRVANPALGYAGTTDLLLYDRLTGKSALKDWKTNEDLRKWYGDMLLPPLNLLKADDLGKYTVQQTMYRIALEGIGLTIGETALIWVREDGHEEVPVDPRYVRLVRYAVEKYMDERSRYS